MRGLGYQRNKLELSLDMYKIESGYTRPEPLTWEMFQQAMDQLERGRWQAELSPLVLPHWLPEPLRPLAEQWAREHGWDGVVYDDIVLPARKGGNEQLLAILH